MARRPSAPLRSAALAAWTLRPARQLSRLPDEELEERHRDPPHA